MSHAYFQKVIPDIPSNPLLEILESDVSVKSPRLEHSINAWKSGKCNSFVSDELLGLEWTTEPAEILIYDDPEGEEE